jgi:hypothetical protein
MVVCGRHLWLLGVWWGEFAIGDAEKGIAEFGILFVEHLVDGVAEGSFLELVELVGDLGFEFVWGGVVPSFADIGDGGVAEGGVGEAGGPEEGVGGGEGCGGKAEEGDGAFLGWAVREVIEPAGDGSGV